MEVLYETGWMAEITFEGSAVRDRVEGRDKVGEKWCTRPGGGKDTVEVKVMCVGKTMK